MSTHLPKPTITRAEFAKLNAHDQSKFCRNRGKIVEDAARATATAADVQTKPFTLAKFNELSPREKADFRRNGGTIVN